MDILWIFTNIASGDGNQTNFIVELGVLDMFIKNLANINYDLNT